MVPIQQGSGIRCPQCGGISRIRNTVALPEESAMKRYRQCDECMTRFVTRETVTHETPARKVNEKNSSI